MLKGKTKIELIDTRNGKISTYENTNMFTNEIQNLLSYTSIIDNNKFQNNIGASNYNGVLSNGDYPTINYFTGGLLLFSDYISEDVNNINIPANNQIIGRACLENNDSTQIGSRNGNLISSEFIDGKTYEYVWEFNEPQANGIISCASLTTPFGAVSAPLDAEDTITHPDSYPYKNNDFKCVSDGNGNATNNFVESFQNESYLTKDFIAFVDGTNNCYYCFSTDNWNTTSDGGTDYQDVLLYWKNNRKILLHKYRFPYNNFSIFDNRKAFNESNKLLDTVQIDIPNTVDLTNLVTSTSSSRISVCNDDDYLYILLSNTALGQNQDITNATALSKFNSFNPSASYQKILYLMKIDLSNFTMEVIDLSSSELDIFSWCGGSIDYYKNPLNNKNNTSMNLLNDIYVYNDCLYFFKKDNVDTTNNTFDLVLCFAQISNPSTVTNVKYNGNDIVIKCAVYSGDDKEPYNILNSNRRFCGKYLNIYFSLGVPFVSMISNGNSLFVTFIENNKTFMINGSTAYLLNENNNELFNINIKKQLTTPIYPRNDSYAGKYDYWKDGLHSIDFVYAPDNEKLFYIVGGKGKILKIKNKQTNSVYETENPEDTIVPLNDVFVFKKHYNNSSTTPYYEYGCYDILRDSTPLVTINNLDNQVEKKSYQKMRVTYTITEV